jgi:hypothetical protein
MLFSLIADVLHDPRQVLCAETHDAIAALPIEQLVSELPIDVVRRSSLQLPGERADGQGGRNAHGQVDVGFNSADCVEMAAGWIESATPDGSMRGEFDVRSQNRCTLFRVPRDVEVDFGVASGQGDSLRRPRPSGRGVARRIFTRPPASLPKPAIQPSSSGMRCSRPTPNPIR